MPSFVRGLGYNSEQDVISNLKQLKNSQVRLEKGYLDGNQCDKYDTNINS